MAIGLDTHLASDAGGTTSMTLSYTCTGTNLLLIVGVNANSTTDVITGVTYNAIAMTRANALINTAQGSTFIYYLVAPATGAHNIVVSASSATLGSIRATSYTGVGQTGFPDAQKTASQTGSTSSTFSTTITTVANNSWIYAIAASDHGVLSAGTNLTLRDGGTATNLADFDTNGAITPAGSTTLGFASTAGTSHWAVCMMSFAPVAAAATPKSLALLGVG